MVNPPSEDNLPGEDEVLYRSQVQGVLIPYTTKEDTYNYYETRNYVNDVNRDHTQVLQTYDDQLQKRETYVYGNGRATYTNESTGDSYHYLTSQSGSVTGLTQNGQAVASSSYALYGETKQTTDTTGNPFAYNGEARDITGLDYLRARYYDNQAGTFLTADSYQGSQTDPLSQNLYAYVQNNPANYTDPSGHIGRPNINLPDSRGSRKPKRSSQSKSNQSKVYPIFPSGTSIIDQQLIIANQSAAQGLVDAQKRFIQETKGYSYNPIVDMFRDPLGPSRSPIDYGSTPFATITRSYIDSVLTTARQTVYTPPPSDYERAVQSGQSTYDWSRSTTREAKNIHRNWTKALEETIRHVCNTQTAKGKDSGQTKTKIDDRILLTLGIIGSINGIALGLYDWFKKNPIGISNTNTVSSSQSSSGVLFSGFVDYTSQTATGDKSWLNIDFINDKPSGMTFNMNTGSLSLGYEGGNWSVSGSGNYSKYNTISGSISFEKDGFEANYVNSAIYKNEVSIGNGAGIKLSPDIVAGMLNIYNTFETGQSKDGVTITNTVNTGLRTINGSQATVILSLLALLLGNPAPMEQIQQLPLTP
ncbi:TPA: RHS repeat-associated core domain-containing protein [Streptococcus suis]|uniref:RHS repeat-associated core domain-containing protein n=1 Tax=Streptococcus suis TaxID=1307 RepID=UPI00209AEAE8|nr:RHS repeat-associated core domain-containing protein [Streptococcus suis]MCO8208998.1 RHS repeat-associated core domain-containing protein [Streptococcus suis]HEM3488581.1 RHS repeat-associated core domain-containing protein [Streptococcus suis]HEM3507282.1 RHS repeat-associated core domain-containing protein [Streptococcus suis]